MEIQDQQTSDAVANVATILATAYQRYDWGKSLDKRIAIQLELTDEHGKDHLKMLRNGHGVCGAAGQDRPTCRDQSPQSDSRGGLGEVSPRPSRVGISPEIHPSRHDLIALPAMNHVRIGANTRDWRYYRPGPV
jgi:hypothetical protein